MTSRIQLNVQDERIYEVSGMVSPEDEAQTIFEEIEAVELFIQHARRGQPDYQLEETDKPAVVQICKLVDGLPLGIQLAAGWVRTLPVMEIAKELADDIDFLETSMQDLPARQRSMRAAFNYSWKLLPEKLQAIFQNLSVFRGGFTREAAKEVAKANVRVLASLVNQSLLQRTPDGRFTVHELMRQFAQEGLETTAQTQVAGERHSAYFADLLHQLQLDIFGGDQLGALAKIDVDFENVRAAWGWAVSQKDYDALGHLAQSLLPFGWRRNRLADTSVLFQQALEILPPLTGAEPHPVLARMVAFHEFIEGTNESNKRLRRALAVARQHDDRWGEAMILWTMGGQLINDFDYEGAVSLFEQSAELFEKLDDQTNLGYVQIVWGAFNCELGNEELGHDILQKSVETFRACGDRFGLVQSKINLGWQFVNEGNFTKAETLYKQAAETSFQLGAWMALATIKYGLGSILVMRGNYKQARIMAQELTKIGNEINHSRSIFRGFALLAEIEIRIGNYDKAQTNINEAISLDPNPTGLFWINIT
ncbi:MAG: hypothetical protein N2D54_07155, partial [Chloroflexota bacterium]